MSRELSTGEVMGGAALLAAAWVLVARSEGTRFAVGAELADRWAFSGAIVCAGAGALALALPAVTPARR